MSGLPGGWANCGIGDLIKPIEKGQPQSDFTYIDISSIDNKTKKILEPNLVEESKAPSRARQHLEKGDVLVSMTRPNLNAVAILDTQYSTPIASTGFDVLRADHPTNNWLFFHVRSKQFVDVMTEKVQGALYPAIKSADIRDYKINLLDRIDVGYVHLQPDVVKNVKEPYWFLPIRLIDVKHVPQKKQLYMFMGYPNNAVRRKFDTKVFKTKVTKTKVTKEI
jgi:hypothetical protein